MIQINLLDWRIRKQRIRFKMLSITIMALLFITTISSLFLLHSVKSFNHVIQTNITQQQQNIQRTATKISLIKNQLNKLDWLQMQSQKIKLLENNKHTLLKFLIILSNEIPHDLWLTTLLYNEKQLMLEGYALHYSSIANFVTQLKRYSFSQYLKIAHIKQQQSTTQPPTYLAFRLEEK